MPEPATFRATGREGEHEGVTYVEYEMLDSDGSRVSLAEDNVNYIKQDGQDLEPNTDETLWFNKSKPTGSYVFEVETKDGVIYQATLNWTNPGGDNMAGPNNSAQIGLADLHVALLTKDATDGVEYETPIKLAPAVSASLTSNMDSAIDYGDDGPVETASSFGGVEIEIETTQLNVQQQALLLGQEYKDGLLVNNSIAVPPYLALGFKSLKADGNYLFVWLYKGKFESVDQQLQTKGESVEFQHPTIRGTFVKRDYDDNYKISGDSSDPDFTYADTWFDGVVEPPAPTP